MWALLISLVLLIIDSLPHRRMPSSKTRALALDCSGGNVGIVDGAADEMIVAIRPHAR